MLLFVAVATIAFVPLNLWQQYFSDLRASTGYVQNWHLASTAVDYFHSADAPSPVQHFWSLAVEEQFYIVWPVLMLLGLALAPALLRRRAIGAGMALLTVASFLYAIRYTPQNPSAAYFRHANARVGVRPRRAARAAPQLRALARRAARRPVLDRPRRESAWPPRSNPRRRRSPATPRCCPYWAPSRSCAPARRRGASRPRA